MVKENHKVGYKLELLDDNVIYLVLDKMCKIGLIEAKVLREEVLIIANEKPFRTIVDFRGVTGVTNQEARQFMSLNENFKNLKLCDAFITESYSTSMLIGFYLKIFKPNVPTKSFSTFDEAFSWVNNF